MSSEQAPGLIPLVFESGVVNIDEEGVLHVHLPHGPDAPHPMVTHPDGEETTIPADATEVRLNGGARNNIRVRCSLDETDELPQGFVFRIEGWQLVQLEMSGDLTVTLDGLFTPPSWFQPGKVHRFDGPGGAVRIFTGSQPLVAARPPSAPTPRRSSPTPPSERPTSAPRPEPGRSEAPAGSPSGPRTDSRRGCAGLLILLLALGGLAGSMAAVV